MVIEGEGTIYGVPNAPCGVESKGFQLSITQKIFVPNAPCGVERSKPHPPRLLLTTSS